jgi:hypothetical protein
MIGVRMLFFSLSSFLFASHIISSANAVNAAGRALFSRVRDFQVLAIKPKTDGDNETGRRREPQSILSIAPGIR